MNNKITHFYRLHTEKGSLTPKAVFLFFVFFLSHSFMHTHFVLFLPCFTLFLFCKVLKGWRLCYFYSMALQIKSLKESSIVRSLLMDFVSQSCFELPKERNCNRKRFQPNLWQMLHEFMQVFYQITFSCVKGYWDKFLMFLDCLFFSCSQRFTKASDLLGALKKIEERDTAVVRKSGRKRGIPVRLYKRCLRLEREADVIAQLTWLYKLQCATMNLSIFTFLDTALSFFSLVA